MEPKITRGTTQKGSKMVAAVTIEQVRCTAKELADVGSRGKVR